MPIYAYKCAECGHAMDVIRKVSDPLLTDCPSCGKPALVKQVTAAGFQLKGAGWYVTDFRDSGSGKKKDAAKPDESAKTDQASDAKSDTKPDAKPATTADAKSESTTKGETKTESKAESKGQSGSSPAPAPAASTPKTGTSSSGTS